VSDLHATIAALAVAVNDLVERRPDSRLVFVVHGRNLELRDELYTFLRALDLKPLSFADAVRATNKASPYVLEVINTAFEEAQAFVVLFTPDDEARLRHEFVGSDDGPHERELTPQPRPNVLLEAGMALGRYPERTILVEVGKLRPISDLGGLHAIRLSDDTDHRYALADRLRAAGCKVDTSTGAWLKAGKFSVARKLQEQALNASSSSHEQPITKADKQPVAAHLTSQKKAIIKLLSVHASMRLSEVAKRLGISKEIAYKDLEELLAVGLLKKVNPNGGLIWHWALN